MEGRSVVLKVEKFKMQEETPGTPSLQVPNTRLNPFGISAALVERHGDAVPIKVPLNELTRALDLPKVVVPKQHASDQTMRIPLPMQ